MTHTRHPPDRELAFRKWLSMTEARHGPLDLTPLDTVRAVRSRLYPNETRRELIALLRLAAGLSVIDFRGEATVVSRATWARLSSAGRSE